MLPNVPRENKQALRHHGRAQIKAASNEYQKDRAALSKAYDEEREFVLRHTGRSGQAYEVVAGGPSCADGGLRRMGSKSLQI